MNPQVAMINRVTKMYESGCKCQYGSNIYDNKSMFVSQCTAFITPDGEEITDILIHFGDEKLTKHVKVKIEGDKLSLSDYEN